MASKVEITAIAATAPPTFHGQYRGEPIVIGLDSSAVLKLEGNERFGDLPGFLSDDGLQSDDIRAIERAVQRLIEMRDPTEGRPSMLTVSALDFD